MTDPQPTTLIRPLRLEDGEALWRIARQEGVIETTMGLPSDRLHQRTERLAQLGPDDHWFVAEVNGEVVGLAGMNVGRGRLRHSGHVFLFVAREYQRQGIGRRLLEALLDVADNWLLLRRVELTVIVGNDHAKRLYERLGFEVEGRRKLSIVSQGELKDEWLMARYR
ncbi:MAG TPA: GNAT family N-acetyltransferase [Ktedonobacterales bacterium]|jgi:putative acetyltransferase